MFKHWIFVFFIILVSSGCTTSNLYKSSEDLTNGPVFVIGIDPENFLAQFVSGSTDKGYFVEKFMGTYVSSGWPTDGYLIVKGRSGIEIALAYMRHMKKDSVYGGRLYCARGSTPVFTLKEGEVAYITDVKYLYEEDKLLTEYTDRYEKAKDYLKVSYPELADKLVRSSTLRFLPASISCSNVIVY